MAVVTTFLPSDTATQKRYRYYVCDTEAELPASPDEGDIAYAKDTDEMFYRTTSAWRQVQGAAATFTPGSVIFAGASGVLAEDNANLFWDDSGDRLGIGINTGLQSTLHIEAEAAVGGIFLDIYHDSAGGPAIVGRKSRGTAASPVAIQTNDGLYAVTGRGYDGTAFSLAQARCNLIASENWSGSAHGAKVNFDVTPNGTTTVVTAVTIENYGGVTINDTARDADTRIEGDTEPNLIFVDASTDRVGFGTNTPTTRVEVDGVISGTAGTGTDLAKMGGAIDASGTQTGNAAGVETDLFSTNVLGGTLGTNLDSLEFVSGGTFAASINAKRLRVKFGATTIFDTGALAITAATDWTLYGWIIRTGATTQKAAVFLNTSSGTLAAYADYSTPAETLSGDVTLKVTGEAVGANDVVGEMWKVQWIPAP